MKEYRTVPRTTRSTDVQRRPAVKSTQQRPSAAPSAQKPRAASNETQAVDSFFTRPADASNKSYSNSNGYRQNSYEPAVTGPAHASSYRAPAKKHTAEPSSHKSSAHSKPSRSSGSSSSGSHVKSIIAMALGISSVVVAWAYMYGSIYSIAAGIVALCLAKADANAGVVSGAGFRKTAKITGIIGIVLGGISFIAWLIIALTATAVSTAFNLYY